MHLWLLPAWTEFRLNLTAMVKSGLPNSCEGCGLFAQQLFGQIKSQLEYSDLRNEYSIPIMAQHISACNSGSTTDDSLYGTANVLWWLAWDAQQHGVERMQVFYLQTALNVLGERTRRNMDFMESSEWPVRSIDLVMAIDDPALAMLPLKRDDRFLQFMRPFLVSTGSAQLSFPFSVGSIDYVGWELGVHAALTAEVTTMMQLNNASTVYRLITNQYPSWRKPTHTDPLPTKEVHKVQDFFQNILPWSAISADSISDINIVRELFRDLVYDMTPPHIVICTLPVLCYLFAGLGWNVLGYFGHPLLFMVDEKDKKDIIDWARGGFRYVVTDPFLAMQYAYLMESTVPFVRTLALYTLQKNEDPIYDILVWERPHDVTLICSIQKAMRQYAISNNLMELPPRESQSFVASQLILVAQDERVPLRFVAKSALLDRSYATFAKFQAVVIFPYDMDLVAFYEFVQMGIPILIPSSLDKYFFFQNHAKYDFPSLRKDVNPFNESNAETTRHNLEFTDYFKFPNISKFWNLQDLVRIVHEEHLPKPSFPPEETQAVYSFWNQVLENSSS